MKHLLSVAELGRDGIEEVMRVADSFLEVTERSIPKVPTLRGKTVASLFFEDSTRTRLSFETAAKRLSADVMGFSVSASSVNKGESLRDTVQTITAMGVDGLVVRHASAGVPHMVAGWTDASVINAGDGWHEHPTQALLDCYTILRHGRTHGSGLSIPQGVGANAGLGGSLTGDDDAMEGMRITIVGDVKHSRVARSDVSAFTLMGARVTLVAPPTLLPPCVETWPVEVSQDLDETLAKTDIVYMLRLQKERTSEALVPSLREYVSRFGLDGPRAARLAPGTLVMHPGPMNRGVEMAGDVADSACSLVTDQVRNGVAVRMAVLFLLLGSGAEL
ncbi:MAG: aspartate carbamoyltransferase catalytic subunit [Acidimicrobiales bacterium]